MLVTKVKADRTDTNYDELFCDVGILSLSCRCTGGCLIEMFEILRGNSNLEREETFTPAADMEKRGSGLKPRHNTGLQMRARFLTEAPTIIGFVDLRKLCTPSGCGYNQRWNSKLQV